MDGQQSRQQGEFTDLILASLQCHEAQEHSSRRDLTYTSSASSLYRRNHLAQPDYSTEMGLQSNRTYHSDSEGSFADTHFSYEPGCLASVARWPLKQVTGHIPNNERTQQCLPHEHLDCTGYTHNLVAERVVDTHGSTNFDQAPASQSHHTVYTADTRSEMMNPWNTGLSSLQHPLTTPTMEELQRGTLPRADEVFHGQQVLMPPCPQTSSFTDQPQLSIIPCHYPIYSPGLMIDGYSQSGEMQGIEGSSQNNRSALNCHLQPQPFHFFNDLAQQDPLYPLSENPECFAPLYQYISLPSEEEQGTSQIYEDTFQNNQPGQAQLRLSFLQDCAYGNPSGPLHQGLNLPLSQTATSAVDDDLQTQFDTLIAGNLLPPDVPQGLILPVLPSLDRSEFFFNQTSNPGASKPQDGHNERGWLTALNKAAHGFSALLFNTNKLRRGPSGTACVRCSFDRIKCVTPPDRAGACRNCYELGLGVSSCRPRMIRDLKTFDKWLAPEYRCRLTEIDIGSIIAHSDRKTSLTHYPDGPFIQVICRKFISTDDLQILVHRRNGKEMCSRKTTPWLLVETPDIKRYVSDCVLDLFREFEGDKRPIAELLRLARDVFCSTHEPLLYAIFQMLTILRLLRLGWQFDPKTSETLDMIIGNHENSPWDGRNPIPRMISNQLTVALEERMISIDNWVTKRFDEILTKRVRLSWIVVLMSTFIYAHVRELDAGRNIHWSRHPESQRFWSHPKRPAELLGEGVVDCNVMLSQVYAVCKPEKDFESWDDEYRRNLAEPHQELQTMVEKLQCLVTAHRHEGWIGREGKQEYVEGDSSSVSYTMSSLVFCTPDRNPVVDNFE